MSANEHSNRLFYPGPYRVLQGEYLDDYAVPIRDKDDKVIARIAAGIGNKQVRMGTARLLAASPTMYEAIYKTMLALQASGLWNTEEPFMEALERAMGEVLGADAPKDNPTK